MFKTKRILAKEKTRELKKKIEDIDDGTQAIDDSGDEEEEIIVVGIIEESSDDDADDDESEAMQKDIDDGTQAIDDSGDEEEEIIVVAIIKESSDDDADDDESEAMQKAIADSSDKRTWQHCLINTEKNAEEGEVPPKRLKVDVSREPGCSQEMSKPKIKTQTKPDRSAIHGKVTVTDHTLQTYLLTVKKTWKVVSTLTGYKLAIIPPMSPSPKREVGHWINFSKKVIPFVYVTSKGERLDGNDQLNETVTDKRVQYLTAAYLITEYVGRVTEHLEQAEDEVLGHYIKNLKDVHILLIWLMQDVEGYLMSSTTQNLPLTMSKIKELKKKIGEISNLDKIHHQTTPPMITVTENDLLCSILELQENISKRMTDIKDDQILHRSPLNFIKDIMAGIMEEMIMHGSSQSEENRVTSLVLLGFSQEKSLEIVKSIPSQYHTMQSPLYWATEYLELAFSTHPLLTMIPYVDKYANQAMNQWFRDTSEQRAPGDKHTIILGYEMIKVGNDRNNTVTSEMINEKFQLDGHKLLFHGAKHANSVDRILRKGIMLNYGSNYMDFSHGSGFYMSDNFEAAKEWATMRKNSPPSAVIVYRIPENLLVYGDMAGLDLSQSPELWSSVIRYHRTGYEVEDGVPNINQRTFIKGPSCKNGYTIQNDRNDVPTPLCFQGSELQQYCIRSQGFAQTISAFVVSVVIYNVKTN